MSESIYQDHKDYTLGYLYFFGHDPSVPKPLNEEMLSCGFTKNEFVDNDNFPNYLYIRESTKNARRFCLHTKGYSN